MTIDRERIQYLLDDFRSRPERVRWAKAIGKVLGVFVLAGIVLLLTLGKPKAQPKAKPKERPIAAASSGVQDAFAYAKDLEGRLRVDARYGRLYLVPSAANATHAQGKVVVMGEIGSEAELLELQVAVARAGVPVALEWQVSFASPGASAPASSGK